MSMVVRTNTMATNAYRQLGINNNALAKSLEKLSSGFRINRAGDDASGLAISEKMKAQIKGLEQASANSQDGISLVQTAEGALTEVHSMLNRMTELATKSANGTIQDDVDRDSIQTEVDALKTEITRIAKSTNFNGINLLDGSLNASKLVNDTVNGVVDTIQINKGMETGKLVDGTGSKGEYTIDIKGTLGEGDSMKLNYTDATGTAKTLTFKRYGADAAADEIAIDGDTVAAQTEAIKAKLVANLSEDFDISAEGSKLTLKSKVEGLPQSESSATGIASITGIEVKDSSVKTSDTIKIDTAFADTNTLTVNYKKADGTAGSITLTGQTGAVTASDRATKFSVDTNATAQAADIKAALEADTDFAKAYDVSVKADGIMLSAKTDKAALTSATATGGTSAVTATKAISETQGKAVDAPKETRIKIGADTAWADGDTLAITFKDVDGTEMTTVLSAAATSPDITNGQVGTTALGSGPDAATAFADALNNTTNTTAAADEARAAFTIFADGDELVLRAKDPDAAFVSQAASTAANATISGTANTAVSLGNLAHDTDALKLTNGGYTTIAGGTKEFKVGDVLEFNFNLNGKAAKAKVELTAENFTDNGMSTEGSTTQIANALKDAKFEDIEGTFADESKLTVGDVFNISANKKVTNVADAEAGSINIGAKIAGDQISVGAFSVTRDGSEVSTLANAGSAGIGGTDGSTAVATAYTTAINVGETRPNFTAGDKFELSGTLSGGQTFTVSLEAGKDFAIGADVGASMTNIKSALDAGQATIGGNTVAVNAKVDGEEVSSNTIFAGNEFTITANDGTASNTITVTSATTGAVYDSTKTAADNLFASGGNVKMSIVPSSAADAEAKILHGTTPSAAHSSITFKTGEMKYGSALSIAGKTFEIVAKAEDVVNANNIAIVVDNIEKASGDDVAKTIEDKINNDSSIGLNTEYAATAINGKLTIATKSTGSDKLAPEISLVNGTSINGTETTFKPADIKVGQKFTVNEETFQFYQAGKPPVEAEAGVNYVSVDLTNATSKDIADAVASKINDTASLSAKMSATVDTDGSIAFTSKLVEDGKYKDSSFEMTVQNKSVDGSLTLQIGDTSDDFNKIKVSVDDLSAEGLGIASMDVSSQTTASDAIKTIKSAINKVSTNRGNLGALQNRLEHAISNLDTTAENMESANSRIRDTDMAKEMMQYTKMNILTQAAQAMLAQANQQPQAILQLLQ